MSGFGDGLEERVGFFFSFFSLDPFSLSSASSLSPLPSPALCSPPSFSPLRFSPPLRAPSIRTVEVAEYVPSNAPAGTPPIRVAVKRLRKGSALDAVDLAHEARVLRGLSHRHITKYIGVGASQSTRGKKMGGDFRVGSERGGRWPVPVSFQLLF